MLNPNRLVLKALVRGLYDLQHMRIIAGQRIVANFKAKLGQTPGSKEEILDKEGREILAKIRKTYDHFTEGVAKFPKQAEFNGDEIISSYADLCLARQFFELEKQEESNGKLLEQTLKDFPAYEAVFRKFKGIGPAMAGVFISCVEIEKAAYPSSLWKLCGVDVGPDGRGRGKYAEHLVGREYQDTDGNTKTKKGVTFNPWLKSKLLGVIAPGFMMLGPERSKYAQIYKDYKHRLENHVKYGIANDGKKDEFGRFIGKARRHKMALRYAAKIFLIDLHGAWRAFEGLPPSAPYSEAKLGHKHHETANV